MAVHRRVYLSAQECGCSISCRGNEIWVVVEVDLAPCGRGRGPTRSSSRRSLWSGRRSTPSTPGRRGRRGVRSRERRGYPLATSRHRHWSPRGDDVADASSFEPNPASRPSEPAMPLIMSNRRTRSNRGRFLCNSASRAQPLVEFGSSIQQRVGQQSWSRASRPLRTDETVGQCGARWAALGERTTDRSLRGLICGRAGRQRRCPAAPR